MGDRRKVLDLFEKQNDAWSKRAAEGIERYRKGNGRVTVVDREGNPIPNAKMKLIQKSDPLYQPPGKTDQQRSRCQR